MLLQTIVSIRVLSTQFVWRPPRRAARRERPAVVRVQERLPRNLFGEQAPLRAFLPRSADFHNCGTQHGLVVKLLESLVENFGDHGQIYRVPRGFSTTTVVGFATFGHGGQTSQQRTVRGQVRRQGGVGRLRFRTELMMGLHSQRCHRIGRAVSKVPTVAVAFVSVSESLAELILQFLTSDPPDEFGGGVEAESVSALVEYCSGETLFRYC